jgi:hypothetical protein
MKVMEQRMGPRVSMIPGHLMEVCVFSRPIFSANSSPHFGHLNGQGSSSSYIGHPSLMEPRHDRPRASEGNKKAPQAVIADRSSPTLAMDATTHAACRTAWRPLSATRATKKLEFFAIFPQHNAIGVM